MQNEKEKQSGKTIYAPGSFNARWQMNHYAIANKSIYTSLEYDVYGLPAFFKTGHSYPGSTNIQFLETQFDAQIGNLTWRKDRSRNLTEDFTYDTVHKNRLATWQVQGQQIYSTTYNDANGNIKTKTDFTSPGNPYSYGLNAGPHAVTGVTEPLLMPAEAEQEIRYNSFNKASLISHNYQRRELFLHYGPDEQRIKTEYKINGQTTLTKYFPGGGLEVEVSANGSERWLHYLPGGGLYVCDENFDKIGMYYVLTDYTSTTLSTGLGSWDKVISETGSPIEEYSFDPWGRRRNPTNWTYTGVPSSFTFARGYTGHEMLDAFGLVNMNGRMYDPVMGRMLSPDNYVSLPEHTQGYNRYTYALNNPLIITDPSGDNPILLFIAFAGVLNGAVSAQNGDGFLQGFSTGVATGMATSALSAGVGAAVGTLVGDGTRLAQMTNAGIHAAVAGGITYGADALVNNTAFNWKAYGMNIATSMALAGLSYQKPGAQLPTYSYDGLPFDPGRGYGMRFPDPPDWTWGKNERGAVLNIPGTEIISTAAISDDYVQLYGALTLSFDPQIGASLTMGIPILSGFFQGPSMEVTFKPYLRYSKNGSWYVGMDIDRMNVNNNKGYSFPTYSYEKSSTHGLYEHPVFSKTAIEEQKGLLKIVKSGTTEQTFIRVNYEARVRPMLFSVGINVGIEGPYNYPY